MARATYYVEIGGSKYAWRAEEDKYKDIASAAGIKKATTKTKGLLFGSNTPKPARVRLNFEDGLINKDRSSQIVFVNPSKVGDILDGSLRGKKSNGMKIGKVSLPG